MRKSREYISDVQKKIIKKRARAVKIPISTIRAIIKNFQSTENITKLPGRGRVCIVLMHGEEESLSGQRLSKDHSWRNAEHSWVSGSENLKTNVSNSTFITTCFSGGFQDPSRAVLHLTIILAHPKTNSTIFSYQTRLELQMGRASMVRWN